jgi:predicted ATPase
MHLNRISLEPDQYPTRDYYPFNLDLLHQTSEIRFDTAVTFFSGENGAGKSTLLEAIATRCRIHIWKPEVRARVDRNPYEDDLYKYINVEWADGPVPGSFFAADIFENFCLNLDDWASNDPGQLEYFGGRSLMTQSHGQSLMSFFTNRYRIKGLFLLDEPETALSPKSQIQLLRLLNQMSRNGHAQFIVASHSPILMACPGATIYSFDQAPIQPIQYEDTDYYRLYRDFMLDREKFLEE